MRPSAPLDSAVRRHVADARSIEPRAPGHRSASDAARKSDRLDVQDGESSPKRTTVKVEFVVPNGARTQEDQE
jgi:hypothetical protein